MEATLGMTTDRMCSLLRITGASILVLVATFALGQSPAHVSGLTLPKPGAYLRSGIEHDLVLPKGIKLPEHVDLSRYFPVAGDQGAQASCTAWAMGYGLMSYNRNLKEKRAPDKTLPMDPATVFSPGFLFNVVKISDQPDRSPDACLSGVDFEATYTVGCEVGACTMADFGYDGSDNGCKIPIPAKAMDAAVHHRLPIPVSLFHSRDSGKAGPDQIPFDPVQWKYHLWKKEPIVIGISIDCDFETDGANAAEQGRPFIWNNTISDSCSTGHAVVCTGYTTDSTFTFFNSFGTAWADSGYFQITYPALYANCTQAYVFVPAPKDSVLIKKTNVVHRDSIAEGTTLGTCLKPRRHIAFKQMEVHEAFLSRNEKELIVHFVDAASHKVIQTLAFAPDQPISFVEAGALWTFEYRRPHWLARLFSNAVPIEISVDANADDLLQQGYERYLDHFRQAWK
ncbi:MAG: hypothetical protein ABI432_15900 [Flavobacteriales bacterium]